MFSGSIRGAIHALKYRGDRRLIEPLADALAERWASVAVGGDQVTWVPVHETRRRERGFDQAEELAKGMAERLHIPAAACLERRYKTDAQHALGRQDRAGNIEGVFAVPPAVREAVSGHWLVLVDDVITTGATLASCTAALYAGGAAAVSAITLARDR